MANMVQGTSNGEYDLARSLRLYDTGGDLPERARELWKLIGSDAIMLAREFWRRYSRSPEVGDSFDDAKIEQLSQRIVPYINDKFERLDQPEWNRQAHGFVAKALESGLSLSTLLAGLNAETEAAYAALRAKVSDERDVVRLAR